MPLLTGTVENIQIVSSLGSFLLFVIMSVTSAFVQKKLNLHDTDISKTNTTLEEVDRKENVNYKILMKMSQIMEQQSNMIMTAFVNSKLDSGSKREIINQHVEIENTFQQISELFIELGDVVIDESIEQIRGRNEMLANLAQTASPYIKEQVRNIIEEGQSYLEGLVGRD